MKELLEELVSVLPRLNWRRDQEGVKGNDARFFRGSGGGWNVFVADFDISDQGFPKGSRGYDGAATKIGVGTVVHLPREIAEQVFKRAVVG